MTTGTPDGLKADSGQRNEWNGRGLETWKIEESPSLQKNLLKSVNGLASWHPLGRPHKLNLKGVTALEVYMTVVQAKSHSSMWVWLADEFQNGYGVEYVGIKQTIKIFKLRGNERPFEHSRDVSAWIQEFGEDTSGVGTKIADVIEDGALVTIKLRVEQSSPKGPVTLTAWNVIDQGGTSTDYDGPIARLVDDGSGSTFSSSDKSSGPAFNLEDLTYLAFSASNNKDGQPVFSNVGVEVVKEATPSAATKR